MSYSVFDSILENKIGFGRYQYISYIFIGLTQFSDGSEIVALSILLPVLKNEWKISDEQQGMLGTVLFCGIFLGSLLGGYVSDKAGRRVALLYASIIQFFVGVISTLVTEITLFVLIRGLFGVIIGFTIPLTPSLASEITPVDLRGRGNSCHQLFLFLRKVLCCDRSQILSSKFERRQLASYAYLVFITFNNSMDWHVEIC